MVIGGAPIVLGALVLDADTSYTLDWPAVAAVVYNMTIAFVYCYWAWFKIVSRAPAGVSALGTLMIPVVGVFSSMLVLGERPSWQEYAALLLVLGSIATVLIPARRT
jgi:drug/metabolite transporter (DMT)-like permease